MQFVLRKLIFDVNLERAAKDQAKALTSTLRFWFRRKYNLPPTDDRYLDMTEEAMLVEFWAHYYYDQPEGESETSTDNFEAELAAMEAEMGALPDDDFEDISHG